MPLQAIKQLLLILYPDEKRNLFFLSIFMVLNALVQVFGIALIAPLIAAITMPDSSKSFDYIDKIYNFFEFQSHNDFSIFAGIVILATMLFGNMFILATNYLSLRFANNRERSIGTRLLQTYIRQPYSFFLNRHSTELLRNIHNEVAYIATNIVSRVLNLIAFSITTICILIFIFIIDPVVTLILISILSSAYGFIYLFVKKPLYDLGKQNVELTEEKFRTITDSIHMIKEIKMQGLESMFLTHFSSAAMKYARVRTLSDTLGMFPKYLIEIFAVAALVFAIIYMVSRGGSQAEILPVLGMYAFAGFRLMPALQNMFLAVSKIQFSMHSLKLVVSEIEKYEPVALQEKNIVEKTIPFTKDLQLKNIYFSYNEGQPVLKDINIDLPYGGKIAIAGKSGEGKSTIIDLIAGLTTPDNGKVTVDGMEISENDRRSWRKNVAYTSQNIYLLDSTIDMNITLEEDINRRNTQRLEIAKQAALIDFDDHQDVGENGQRLSGGQKQRIGIARALYQANPLLIFDEATSAIDNEMERQILHHIETLDTTMIFITHKVETMSFCDNIYLISAGEVVESGNFNALKERSTLFNNLLKSSEL